MTENEKESGFVSHLTELRKRLIHSFIFLIIFFVACYFFAEHLYGFLVEPYAQAVKDDQIEGLFLQLYKKLLNKSKMFLVKL